MVVKMTNFATASFLRNFLAKETKACNLALASESFCFVLSLRYGPTIETRWGHRDICPPVRPSICLIFFILFLVYTNYLTCAVLDFSCCLNKIFIGQVR